MIEKAYKFDVRYGKTTYGGVVYYPRLDKILGGGSWQMNDEVIDDKTGAGKAAMQAYEEKKSLPFKFGENSAIENVSVINVEGLDEFVETFKMRNLLQTKMDEMVKELQKRS